MILRLIKKHRRFITFGIVGCVNTLVDFSVFTLCSELAGTAPVPGHIVGYCCGIVCSFILNRNITFKDTSGSLILSRFFRFVALNCITLCISTGLIAVLTGAGMQKYAAKVAVAGVVMIMNYLGSKLFVFNSTNDKS
ncbi:MAG: GtrA family protein [Oscillospiraceae bacterium]|nr:GtrA family protein [Oscillospiraceae bacterium]